jgi:acyl-CoA synthetase (AMP-forming)/AMP-acid ligase II
VPGVTLEVVDDEGVPVSPGTVGELRAKGPNVMLGYWRDEAATQERIRGGWLYTGDLATLDAEGWIIHKGRANALVKIAGFRVHPADVEDFALRRLAVSQAVAVAFEAPEVGTRLALYVKASAAGGSMLISDYIARCRSELPRHLVPDFVQIVDEFPLNHALKIDRPLLARIAEQAAAQKRALA